MKVREAVEEYLSYKKRIKPKTRAGYSYALHVFADWCEKQSLELESIKAKHVGSYIDYLPTAIHPKKTSETKASTYTIAYQAGVVTSFLRWCSLDEDFERYVEARTVERIEQPKRDQLVVETFTTEQVQKMLVACEKERLPELQQRNKAILLLLLDTGIRSEELIGLHLDQIDLSPQDDAKGRQPHIRVFGKGDKWREVGMGERCRKELWRYVLHFRAAGRDTHVPVFLGRTGAPLTYSGLHKSVRIIGERAGIRGVRPHLFRHTFAVMYMRSGGDIYKLSRLLGHASIRVTEDYLKGFTHSDVRRTSFSPVDRAF